MQIGVGRKKKGTVYQSTKIGTSPCSKPEVLRLAFRPFSAWPLPHLQLLSSQTYDIGTNMHFHSSGLWLTHGAAS